MGTNDTKKMLMGTTGVFLHNEQLISSFGESFTFKYYVFRMLV